MWLACDYVIVECFCFAQMRDYVIVECFCFAQMRDYVILDTFGKA